MKDVQEKIVQLKEIEERYKIMMRWFRSKATLCEYDKTGVAFETYGLSEMLRIVCPEDFGSIKGTLMSKGKPRKRRVKKEEEKKGGE